MSITELPGGQCFVCGKKFTEYAREHPCIRDGLKERNDQLKKYYALLKGAPDHDSPEFIEYLKANNPVIWENPQWLVISNVKYDKPEKPWYTAFHKSVKVETKNGLSFSPAYQTEWYHDIDILWYEFGDYEWLKKAKSKQTVPGRFHIHLVKK